jgi:hypothetical protein
VHVLKAIEEIDKLGVPKGRISRRYVLEYRGRFYPPKYVVSLANKYANGYELDPSEFSGGMETNSFLRGLGFNIVEKRHEIERVSRVAVKRVIRNSSPIHSGERCPRCKETIKRLLEKIYGKVETNYKFIVGARLQDFRGMPFYDVLRRIYEALQNYRGFTDFVKASTLPRCDFFVPNPGFIVEFDESQHFTQPRKITLMCYPKELSLGFNREKWMSLCDRINARDNDPPYRDEQRAWYDTLRDFLPLMLDLRPTVRLFSKDLVWCSLNPDDPNDVDRFRRFIEGEYGSWRIEVKGKDERKPFLARIIIAGEWYGRPEESRRLLEDICEYWPEGRRVKFIQTCGGFIQFDWPNRLTRRDIGNNKEPNDEAINVLVEEAVKTAKSVLTNELIKKLSNFADYITLGIDTYKEKISTTKNYINELHAELVLLIDLKKNKIYWTGKSYPTPTQENGLVRITDLKTHFINLPDVGKVMILGCHDLNIFNNRNISRTGKWRRNIKTEFRRLAKEQKPICVLHHPHTTVKTRTWLAAWKQLRNQLPTAKYYAGAGRYHEPNRSPSQYDNLNKVLKTTKMNRHPH